MSIRATNSQPTEIQQQRLQQQRLDNNKQASTAATNQAANKPATPQDSVQLTSQAQMLNQVRQEPKEQQVNRERVEKLKKAIEAGEYQINVERLAQKLSSFEQELADVFNRT